MKRRKQMDWGTQGKQESFVVLSSSWGWDQRSFSLSWAGIYHASPWSGFIVGQGGSYFPLEFCPKCLSETVRIEQYAAVREHIEAFIVLFLRSAQSCTIKCFLFPSASKTGWVNWSTWLAAGSVFVPSLVPFIIITSECLLASCQPFSR